MIFPRFHVCLFFSRDDPTEDRNSSGNTATYTHTQRENKLDAEPASAVTEWNVRSCMNTVDIGKFCLGNGPGILLVVSSPSAVSSSFSAL